MIFLVLSNGLVYRGAEKGKQEYVSHDAHVEVREMPYALSLEEALTYHRLASHNQVTIVRL